MKWRNDPHTLAMSYHSEPKQWKTFFPEFLRDYFVFKELHPLFVLLNGERVAFLRFNRISHPAKNNEKCCEIGINVAPQRRGKGVGTKSLELALAWLAQQGYNAVYAEVKKGNSVSQKAFLQAGFVPLEDGVKQVFSSGDKFPIHRFLATGKMKAILPEPAKVFIIAEAGSNWCVGTGEENEAMAFRLIEAAAEAGADAVKFQVFRPETIYAADAGIPDYLKSAGIKEEMENLFARLSMPYDLVPLLAEKCHAHGIEFMASPFSAADFEAVDPYVLRHKVASYEIGHRTLLSLVARSRKPILLSTGAATDDEIAWALHFLEERDSGPVILMQCTACYPAKGSSLHLRTIPWLRERFGVLSGLSDHSRHPLYAPLAAVALGAIAIEKHFTMDNNLPGPDHAFALTPPELASMVQAVRHIEPMLGSSIKIIDESEEELRIYARRGVQAIAAINEGEVLREDVNVAILRPGHQLQGVHPKFLDEMEGKTARHPIKKGVGIQMGDW
jgi:N-acetylneuraminate synthase